MIEKNLVYEQLVHSGSGSFIALPDAFLLPVALPICNQGKRTTCAAFSGAAIAEYHSGGHHYLSPKFIPSQFVL